MKTDDRANLYCQTLCKISFLTIQTTLCIITSHNFSSDKIEFELSKRLTDSNRQQLRQPYVVTAIKLCRLKINYKLTLMPMLPYLTTDSTDLFKNELNNDMNNELDNDMIDVSTEIRSDA